MTLKGVYEDAHNVYIVMDECRGGDLEQLMEVRSCFSLSLCATAPILGAITRKCLYACCGDASMQRLDWCDRGMQSQPVLRPQAG